MNEGRTQRRLAAILAADAVDYSRLMRADEETTVDAIKRAREIFTREIESHDGRVLDTAGDSILAEFPSVVDGMRCAIRVQQTLAKLDADAAPDRRLLFRIGINLGDVIADGETIYGDGVNVAARLQALAEPGGIRISGAVYDLVHDKLDLGYEFTGKQSVKNIDTPVPVYRIAQGPIRPIAVFARRMRSRTGASLLIGFAGAGLIAGWLVWKAPAVLPGMPDKTAPDPPALVVLPFANLSNDAAQEYFSDGIGGDVTTDLSRLGSLRVIARHTALSYKGQAVKVADVARELGVRYVIDGSVQKAGERVRINVQLTDARNGHQLWAERFDRATSDLFAVQDEIAQRIVEVLALTVSDLERKRLARRYTASVEAYDLLLRGQSHYARSNKEANTQARELYLQAIRLDPQFARAYAAIALTHTEDSRYGWSVDADASMKQAIVMAQRAVALNNDIPQTHWALGYVYLFNKQFDEGVAAAQRAIELDPNNADAHTTLAFGRVYQGRPQDAIPLVRRAMTLNPHYPTQYPSILGRAYYHNRQYAEAVEVLRSAMEMNPERTSPQVYLILSYVALDRLDDANWMAAQLLTHEPDFSVDALNKMLPVADFQELARMKADLHRAGLN